MVLIGFMGAGKSTVGPLLAERLGWTFADVDAELARTSGVSVAAWFAERGEAAFRAAEAELTAELCSRDRLVLAPGGGWILQAGLESVPRGTALVWLRVSAAEAVRRLERDPEVRPLLAGPDPLARAEALLAERERHYAVADYNVMVDGRTPAELVSEIIEWLKTSSS